MIKRSLAETVINSITPGFITIIYGPRRVGKTVLLKQITERIEEKSLWLNGDTEETRLNLSTTSETKLTELVNNYDVIVVDEAQRITNIGLSLKIIIDKFPEKKIFVTGSSSLKLSRGVHESLTGRNKTFRLYPLSTTEFSSEIEAFKMQAMLENQLIYGGYPYLTQISSAERKEYLKSIVADYLFKDVLELKEISSPETLKKLATLLAFQIGQEVSLNELSNSLDIDFKTVRRYISLLKQSFVIFELPSYSKNLRNELSKAKKYYFWDLGVRNTLTDQFLPLDSRTDVGGLWENFLAVERLKKHEYTKFQKSYFFWRTYEGAEVDWVELDEGKMDAFEFKWKRGSIKTPKAFKDNYNTEVEVVNKENYLEFIT